MNPLVSICVPVYNSVEYIEQTLSSLCGQTYQDIEIIVVNDGSTDGSEKEIRKVSDHKVTVINVPNGGASKARNLAYANSNGKYIIFFDADDYVDTGFVFQQITKIDNRDDVVVLSAWGRFYNSDLTDFHLGDTPESDMEFREWINYYWYNGNPMTNPGRVLIPRKLIAKAGPWNQEINLNDDFEFFTRVLLKAKKIIFNSDAVFYYRSGINGLSASNGDAAYQSFYNSIFLSVKQVLSAYEPDPKLLNSCANIWQLFIYTIYPQCPHLVKKAELNIKTLGGSNLPYPSGKLTHTLARVLGWKTAKKVRSLF